MGPQYGFWSLVVMEVAVFTLFALSFFRPRTKIDWRTLGSFSGFLIALFAEMYGFPLTLYLLWSWFGNLLPGLDPLSHNAGHLWLTLLGTQGDPHMNILHTISDLMILSGFILLAMGWHTLRKAARQKSLACTGVYRFVRHPQYLAFMVIMAGFLVQWPTLPTLVMFPILVRTYVRLAKREEAIVREELGEEYDRYAERTPAFIPRLALCRRSKSIA